MNTANCPCCHNSTFQPLIDLGTTPYSGTYLNTEKEPFGKIKLSYEYCSTCALIRYTLFEKERNDYANNDRGSGERLADYCQSIVESFVKRGINREKLVIEVGANDGAFLNILSDAGYVNRLGIEPSLSCATQCRSKGHLVEDIHLNKTTAREISERHGKADLVICRHVLEHIPEPLAFLESIRGMLGSQGTLFLEVPDAKRTLQHLYGHDLWDEHLHYFSLGNLQLLLQKAGFCIDQKMVLGSSYQQSLLVWATAADNRALAPYVDFSENLLLCQQFSKHWGALCFDIKNKLIHNPNPNPNPNPIAAIGASHPQSNFLLYSGLGAFVEILIDDDTNKIGKYAPIPQPVKIISSEDFLRNTTSGTVLRTAFGYDNWMNKICSSLDASNSQIIEIYE